MNRLVVEPIFESSLLVITLIVIAGGLLLMVRPDHRSLTPRQRKILLGLRSAALIILFIALLRPAWVRTDRRPAAAQLVVLADHSRSMSLPDGSGQSRWQTEANVLTQIMPTLAEMDESLSIRLYQYGQTTKPIAVDQLQSFLQSPPVDRKTDIAQALQTALSSAAGQPIAGVILIGDGTSTVRNSNPNTAVRTLQSLDVPLWTVPIGPRNQQSDTRDLAIEQLNEEFKVFSKNIFNVAAVIRARGFSGREVRVQFNLIDEEGVRTEVASRTVSARTAEDTIPLDVELVAPEPGNYRLEVEAITEPGEALTDNNSQIAFLDVREGGGRILYLEGALRFEQRELRRAINASRDLSLQFEWIDASKSSRWPINLSTATEPGRVDVFILGDLDASALGDENLRRLAEAVQRGSGLLMLGGLHTYDIGGYANTPLESVLPIELDPSRRVPLSQEPAADTMIAGPVQLRIRRPHPITLLTRTGSNLEQWRQLPPLSGANRFAGVITNPNVTTLLESQDGEPILVIGTAGNGRVATFAGDTTWQWRLQGFEDQHRRFWRQLLLWLLARDANSDDAIWLQMDARRFLIEDPPEFRAAFHSTESSVSPSKLRAEILSESGERLDVDLSTQASSSEGEGPVFTGRIPELPGGLYRLRVEPVENSEQIAPTEMVFQVIDLDAELSRPLAELDRLEQLSNLTADSGGRSYQPDEMDQLLEDTAELRRRAELPVVEKRRVGDDPVSGWFMMLLMTGLLTAEWSLRRYWGLA